MIIWFMIIIFLGGCVTGIIVEKTRKVVVEQSSFQKDVRDILSKCPECPTCFDDNNNEFMEIMVRIDDLMMGLDKAHGDLEELVS